jgi:hypothetical protein
MATEAQVQANRSNAQQSTGPRTAEGKAVVAQNAVKHGLSARLDVIPGEDQAEFDRHREAMLGELVPVGVGESMLAERIVGLSWRLQRAERLQNEVFDALLADGSSPLARSLLPEGTTRAHEEPQAEGDLSRGRVVLKDFSNGRVLDRLLIYERRIERSLYKTMAELRRLRLVPETGHTTVGAMPQAGRAGGGGAVRGERSGVSEEVGRGRLTHATIAPGGLSWGTRGDVAASVQAMMDEMRKTKPISSEPDGGQLACGQEVAADLLESECRETNPISAKSRAKVDSSSVSEGMLLCGAMGR